METITLEPVDALRITTLVDNATDALLASGERVRRFGLGDAAHLPVPTEMAAGGKTFDALRAEHGFSALVEVSAGGRDRRVLFDTGVTPDGLVANLDRLGLAPDTFEAVVLSHGHFDHVMGLDGLARRLGARHVPLLLHPDFWTQRRLALPNGAFELPLPSRSGIEAAGFAVVEDRQPSLLLDGVLLVTGEVDRTTPYETGMPLHEAYRDGSWQPDPLIHDDQAVVVHVRDKGLAVLTGCGHAGIVNIVAHAKRLTGVDRVCAVLGGFHLSGPAFEPVIAPTVAALTAEAPDLLVPAHCTGWAAQLALANALPEAYLPSAVGSRFLL
jgi:7,8-dihydropterin-6-yl-methyl-4-(beta-D-ribofuranosyl)aminobenzene 5'-phosphate synthase